MQTTSLGPGSRSASQFAAASQSVVPAPPSQAIVHVAADTASCVGCAGDLATSQAAAAEAAATAAEATIERAPLIAPSSTFALGSLSSLAHHRRQSQRGGPY